MQTLIPYIQLILSILLVIGILLQRSEAGLGSGFGSSDGGGTHYTRRGFERFLFIGTIVIAILFTVTSIVSLFFRS